MKVKNTGNNPRFVNGVRIEPGFVEEVGSLAEEDLSTWLEKVEVEESGGSGSDQNTKDKQEEQNSENGGD